MQQKIEEFKIAINKYNNNIYYNKFGNVVAIIIILLQIISLYNLYYSYCNSDVLNPYNAIISFLISYFLADLIGGIAHLYMDNNANYNSIVGPFIAAFHLHHKKPRYKTRPFYKVYFYESGAKLWLPIYLFLVIWLQYSSNISFYTSLCLTSIGILSSVAEVSHYWCHNSKKEHVILSFLQKYRILLSNDHHKYHHINDNINYAFLNGSTDWLINFIAKRFFGGYKNRTDLHVRAYTGLDTTNRE